MNGFRKRWFTFSGLLILIISLITIFPDGDVTRDLEKWKITDKLFRGDAKGEKKKIKKKQAATPSRNEHVDELPGISIVTQDAVIPTSDNQQKVVHKNILNLERPASKTVQEEIKQLQADASSNVGQYGILTIVDVKNAKDNFHHLRVSSGSQKYDSELPLHEFDIAPIDLEVGKLSFNLFHVGGWFSMNYEDSETISLSINEIKAFDKYTLELPLLLDKNQKIRIKNKKDAIRVSMKLSNFNQNANSGDDGERLSPLLLTDSTNTQPRIRTGSVNFNNKDSQDHYLIKNNGDVLVLIDFADVGLKQYLKAVRKDSGKQIGIYNDDLKMFVAYIDSQSDLNLAYEVFRPGDSVNYSFIYMSGEKEVAKELVLSYLTNYAEKYSEYFRQFTFLELQYQIEWLEQALGVRITEKDIETIPNEDIRNIMQLKLSNQKNGKE